MEIRVFQGGYDKNLCYLVWCKESKRASVIDPSVEPLPIFEMIADKNLLLEKIIITHSHHDHISFLDDFLFHFQNLKIVGFKSPVKNLPSNYLGLANREIINIGKNIITAIHTPGHYPDSMCYWNVEKGCLFTGDTMFVGRTGRTISTGSSVEQLYDSIYNKIFNLPKTTMIFPGHNYGYSKSCTLVENQLYSPFFQCKTESEFISVMDNYERNRK